MTYARVRLDTLFIAPPPPAALALARRPHAVVVPSGDEWGDARQPVGVGVSDRMMVGGAAAFRADAQKTPRVIRLGSDKLTINLCLILLRPTQCATRRLHRHAMASCYSC
eukprot:scaffold79669_cov60-Phaeocystis_antarctica.AAC.1